MYDLVAVGSATEDVFVIVREAKVIKVEDVDGEVCYLGLPYGAKVSVDRIEIMTGGAATNVSVAATLMGMKAACLCKLGRDGPGQRVVEELERMGVSVDLVQYTEDFSTGYSVIITDWAGERTILVHRGANQQLTMQEIPTDKLAQTRWLYVGSLGGPAAQTFFELAGFAAEHGMKLAINPGGTQLALGVRGLSSVLAHTEVIFVNKSEAYQMTGVEPQRTTADEQEMLRRLYEAGCKYVVITAGVEGCDAYDGEAFYSVPAYEAKVASTVGAGDSFAAGCIAALDKGLPLWKALKIGAMNAAHVVQQVGAKRGLLTWEEAVRLVAEEEGS
jgi:sugar/nucleoside kinase (ribokinase family)